MTCEEAEEEVLKEMSLAVHRGNPPAEEPQASHGQEPKEPSRTRERCRQAARRLAARGDIVVTQAGKVVDPSFAKGPMELKLPS